jgi:hypothetical protein
MSSILVDSSNRRDELAPFTIGEGPLRFVGSNRFESGSE